MAANIHIEGSSRMSRGEFLSALAACDKTQEYIAVRGHRCEKSLIREWAAHKLFYVLGLWRSHTESVDLEYPQALWLRAAYLIVGGVATIWY